MIFLMVFFFFVKMLSSAFGRKKAEKDLHKLYTMCLPDTLSRHASLLSEAFSQDLEGQKETPSNRWLEGRWCLQFASKRSGEPRDGADSTSSVTSV